MLIALKMKINIGDRLTIDSHRALRDQPARFASRLRKIQIHEQAANPDGLGRGEAFLNMARR
jgi:hypothetical protein